MARLLRSATGNPVASAIDAFTTVGNFLDRRELMASEQAERRLRMERESQSMDFEKKRQDRLEKLWGKELSTRENQETLGHLMAANIELEAAKKEGRNPVLNDPQKKAILKTWDVNPVFDPEKDVDSQMAAIGNIQKFMKGNAAQLMQGGRLDRDKYPELMRDFDIIFEDQINKGSDKHGKSVENDEVSKKVKSVIIDPSDQALVFSLETETPVKAGQVFKHIGSGNSVFTVNPNATGILEIGNIDLSKRPVVRNEDGSISTVLSMSITEPGIPKREYGIKKMIDRTAKGESFIKEKRPQEVTVVIPMISDSGKRMTKDEAIEEYHKTGKHLGKFDSVANANLYAEQIHSDPIWDQDIKEYSAQGQKSTKYDAPLTFGRSGDPGAQVVKLPIQMFDAYLSSHANLGNMIQQLRAQLKPEEFAKEIETIRKTRAENKAISEVMRKVDLSKPVEEQRKQFVTALTEANPDASVKETVELAKSLFTEKHAAMTSSVGKLQQDRARLISQGSSPNSPEIKQIDAAIKKAGTETEKTPSEIKEFEEYENMPKDKQGRYLTFKKESKGKDKDEVSPGELSRRDRQVKEADRMLFDTHKKLASESESTLKSLDELLEEQTIPEDRRRQISDMREAVIELIEKKGLNAREAIAQIKKQKGEISNLKPTPKKFADEIRKKAKTREEAERLTRERGYDPYRAAEE